ncbi:unnamed protein product [marine sediment metagenome]|uniref:Uncharacterized protein n=1 Tax=marine sediment metagenome TaxID=412755 RepID=X1DBX1_9ZZZZ
MPIKITTDRVPPNRSLKLYIKIIKKSDRLEISLIAVKEAEIDPTPCINSVLTKSAMPREAI